MGRNIEEKFILHGESKVFILKNFPVSIVSKISDILMIRITLLKNMNLKDRF